MVICCMAFQFPKASTSFSFVSPPPKAVRRPGKPRLPVYEQKDMSSESASGGNLALPVYTAASGFQSMGCFSMMCLSWGLWYIGPIAS